MWSPLSFLFALAFLPFDVDVASLLLGKLVDVACIHLGPNTSNLDKLDQVGAILRTSQEWILLTVKQWAR